MRRPTKAGWTRAALAGAIAVLLAASGAGSASALILGPPKGVTYFGVSDRGTAAEFDEFAGLLRHHPAVLQTFHPYGNGLAIALARWAETRTRPMLTISTADDETQEELITPRQIATGFGDDYLLRINNTFAKNDIHGYIRPLGEPNRCLNAWAAITCNGTPRGGDYRQTWYRKAFRRIAIIVRGGGTLEEINARLKAAGARRLNRQTGPNPNALPAAPVALVWSPLPGGSPRVPGNFPGSYWPGSAYVDWVATDFYSKYPVWRDLNRFFGQRLFRRKPFALTEFAVRDTDQPRFIRRVAYWARKHPRVRMLSYYRGFGEAGNAYRIGLYPRTTATLRRILRQHRFVSYVPNPPVAPPTAPSEPNPAGAPVSRSGPLG